MDLNTYTDRLLKAGVPKEQAIAQEQSMAEILNQLTTKEDLNQQTKLLKEDFNTQMKLFEDRIAHQVEKLIHKSEMRIMTSVVATILVGILAMFFK